MTGKQFSGMIIGIIGLAIVIAFAGWWIGLGVYLMLWGNNLGQRCAQ